MTTGCGIAGCVVVDVMYGGQAHLHHRDGNGATVGTIYRPDKYASGRVWPRNTPRGSRALRVARERVAELTGALMEAHDKNTALKAQLPKAGVNGSGSKEVILVAPTWYDGRNEWRGKCCSQAAFERDKLLREHHQAKAGERKWQESFDQLAEKHMRQTDDVERLKRELRSAEDAEKTLREIFDIVQQQRDGAQADAAASRRIITDLQAALARHVRP
jgi:hypothetical protein